MELANSTLAKVCRLVTDGTHDTPKPVLEGFPLIKAKEIVGGEIDFRTCDRISEKDHLEVIARSKPECGDTLFAHIGASLGEAAYINTAREFSIKNIALFKPDPSIIDARYFYYLVVGPEFQATAKAARTGSAQPFLSLGHLRAHPIRYHPNRDVQRRVANILSSYDDLIQVNRRRIAILQEIARHIFDEWFVRFQFPGYETAGICEDKPRSLPNHWRIGPLSSVVELHGTSINPRTTPDQLFAHFSFPSFDRGMLPMLESGKDILSNKLVFSPPTILISKLNPRIPRVWRVQKAYGDLTICSTEFLPLKAKSGIGTGWLTALFTSESFISLLKGHAQGTSTSHQRVRPKDVLKLPIVIPPLDIIQRADRLLEDNFDLIAQLLDINSALRSARDLLLPKLISGQIDVSGLVASVAHVPDRVAAE